MFNTQTKTFNLETIALDDAFTAFWISRKGGNLSKRTLNFYTNTAGRFVNWLKDNGVNAPELVTARHVMEYLADLRDRKVADNTLNAHARAIRTLLIFWHEEGFSPARVRFAMPKVGEIVRKALTIDQLDALLKACLQPRDKAIIGLMVDTGARRQEVCNLNWGDLDLKSGEVHIIRGKGSKNRWVGISPVTSRAILAYRRQKGLDLSPDAPVFVLRDGSQMNGQAILLMFRRLSKRVGFHVHAHALRHTYATNAIAEGLSIYEIQQTMGHADIKTTERYIRSMPSKIIEAQIRVSPMMKLARRRK